MVMLKGAWSEKVSMPIYRGYPRPRLNNDASEVTGMGNKSLNALCRNGNIIYRNSIGFLLGYSCTIPFPFRAMIRLSCPVERLQ